MSQENTKIVREQGGDVLRVDTGGKILMNGGTIEASGGQAAPINDVPTAGAADAAANAAAINSILAVLRDAGLIQSGS